MPYALNDQQFPVGYQPWYVYDVKVKAPGTNGEFDRYDILHSPTADGAERVVSTNAPLGNGYVIALEKYEAGMTSVQVAAAGSLIPFVAAGGLQPGAVLTLKWDDDAGGKANDLGQRADIAQSTDIENGRVLGRFRNHATDSKNLRNAAEGDIIHILTGAF